MICCDIEMVPVGLGDSNGWECSVCKRIEMEIASFKMNNPDISPDWKEPEWKTRAIKLVKEGTIHQCYILSILVFLCSNAEVANSQ